MSEPHAYAVELARFAAQQSPCRSKRGAAVFSYDRRSFSGYNRKPQGFDCTQDAACKASCRREAVHAEQAALLAAGTVARGADLLHVKVVGAVIVASGEPSCVECSKLALAAGIAGVWLFHDDGWRRYPIAEFHRLSLEANRP